MRSFSLEHRIGGDKCALAARDLQNSSTQNYKLFNYYPTNIPNCGASVEKLQDFASDNYMTIREGYGFTNACRVDEDSKLRNGGVITNERYKVQLNSRVYHAVPNLARGGFVPTTESKLTQGEDTAQKRSCDVLSEVSIDRFIPLLPCLKDTVQDANHIVPTWTWGGEPTRDTVRQSQFLENNGYVFDGVAWKKRMECGMH
jgi:hypothetical protein